MDNYKVIFKGISLSFKDFQPDNFPIFQFTKEFSSLSGRKPIYKNMRILNGLLSPILLCQKTYFMNKNNNI